MSDLAAGIRDALDAIEARAKAATPGPWTYSGKNLIETPPIEVDEADWGPEGHHGYRISTRQDERAWRCADVELIVAAADPVSVLRQVQGMRQILALVGVPDPHEQSEDCNDCRVLQALAFMVGVTQEETQNG